MDRRESSLLCQHHLSLLRQFQAARKDAGPGRTSPQRGRCLPFIGARPIWEKPIQRPPFRVFRWQP